MLPSANGQPQSKTRAPSDAKRNDGGDPFASRPASSTRSLRSFRGRDDWGHRRRRLDGLASWIPADPGAACGVPSPRGRSRSRAGGPRPRPARRGRQSFVRGSFASRGQQVFGSFAAGSVESSGRSREARWARIQARRLNERQASDRTDTTGGPHERDCWKSDRGRRRAG